MRFVIFRERSRERSQRTSGPISEQALLHAVYIYITMEGEPRIAKQYKCQYCCSCKNYHGKGIEGGKKVSLRTGGQSVGFYNNLLALIS